MPFRDPAPALPDDPGPVCPEARPVAEKTQGPQPRLRAASGRLDELEAG